MSKVKQKEVNKLVDDLELIIPLLEAGDSEGRHNYLNFRQKTINLFGVDTFNKVSYLTNERLYGKEKNTYHSWGNDGNI